MKPKYFVLGFFGVAGLMYLYQGLFPHRMEMDQQNPHSVQATTGEAGAPLVEVVVPELSGVAQAGREVFEVSCAACHGVNAAGQDGVAPPWYTSSMSPITTVTSHFTRQCATA